MNTAGHISVLLGVTLFTQGVVYADWILKEEVQIQAATTSAPSGLERVEKKVNKAEVRTYYIRKNAMRIVEDNGDFFIISKLGEKYSAFRFDVIKKNYQDASQYVPLMALEAMYYIDCDSHPTCQPRRDKVIRIENEKKQINGITAHKMKLLATPGMQKMGNEDMELWLSKDVKKLNLAERYRMAIYAEFMEQMSLITPGSSQMIIKRFNAILKQYGAKIAVRGRSMQRNMVFIKERPILDDQYEIPSGYTLVP